MQYSCCRFRTGGLYLYDELRLKKKDIETKTGKKINIVAISAKNKNKKKSIKLIKIFSLKILIIFLKILIY